MQTHLSLFARHMWLGVFLVLAFAGSAAANVVPASSLTLERVPYRMDNSNLAAWWKPMSVHRGHVYLSFNGHRAGDLHTVRVARYTPRTGAWRQACLRLPRHRRCVRYPDDVGHTQSTLAVDGEGRIHVFASMHHRGWRYWRSGRPGWVKTMRFHGRELGAQGRFTYPVATRAPNGDVWLMIRQSGVEPVRGRLYRWSVSAHRWSSLGSFAAAAGHGVYPDDIRVGEDGRVHLLWSWSGGGAAGIRHAPSYMVYDPSARSYQNAAGEPVDAPAAPEDPVVYQPLEAGEDWTHVMTGFGQRGAKLTIDPVTGGPVIAYRYAAPSDGGTIDDAMVRLAAWNGSGWEISVAHASRTSSAVGATHHGGQPRVYVDDPVTASGTIAVVQHGNADYVYRAVPRERALYLGRG